MDKNEKIVKIPVGGSLGLLALGHRGVIAWRKVRDEAKRDTSTTNNSHNNE